MEIETQTYPFLSLMKSRRSIRQFTDAEVPIEYLRSIIEAAAWAPSGGNRQPWVFIIVREATSIQKVQLFSPGLKGHPSALLMLGNRFPEDATSLMDISMAAENALLHAVELGLGSCAVRSFNQKAIGLLLNLPDSIVPEIIISLGYAAECPRIPPRRRLEETTHWETYGGSL